MSLFKSKRGFTLIELMIVVAIIGILAAIAIPQFASMVAKSQEGATKGNLGTIRSALSIYYGDNEGVYPPTASTIGATLSVGSKYIASLPSATLPRTSLNGGHTTTNTVQNSISDGATGWFYSEAAANLGTIAVNCTHSDLKNTVWSQF